MNLSRKVILASGICAAFLAIGISCTTEDRDVEQKGLFACESNDDCLPGSLCVGADKAKGIEGRCTREEEVDHCVDLDEDGFETVTDEKYVNECGFSDKRPRDPDDNDPTIYPDAPERCDGKDNNGDGCVDGSCPEGADCHADDKKCIAWAEPCWGGGDVSSFDNSACSAENIGVIACFKGVRKHAKKVGDNKYEEDGGACPAKTEDIPGYREKDDCAGKANFDDNCNGSIDEECVSCETKLSEYTVKGCFVNEGSISSEQKNGPNYTALSENCASVGNCGCKGELACPTGASDPKCMSGSTDLSTKAECNQVAAD